MLRLPGDLARVDALLDDPAFFVPLSAGTNAPVTIAGDYVITGAGIPNSNTQRPLIIAYKLGAPQALRADG